MISPSRPRPEIIGHGGAGAYHPMNSEAAIRTALALGVDRIELDVLSAGDGSLVLAHDDNIHDPTGTPHRVDRCSLQQLRTASPDLLTLDDAAALIADRVPLLLDAKRPGSEPALAAAIDRHRWAETAIVSTTHASTIHRLRRIVPHLRLGLSTGHWSGGTPLPLLRAAVTAALRLVVPLPLLAAVAATGATETMLRHEVATVPLVSLFHARGYRVNLWTVDHPSAIRRALDLQPDAIISNRPDLVRHILENLHPRVDDGT